MVFSDKFGWWHICIWSGSVCTQGFTSSSQIKADNVTHSQNVAVTVKAEKNAGVIHDTETDATMIRDGINAHGVIKVHFVWKHALVFMRVPIWLLTPSTLLHLGEVDGDAREHSWLEGNVTNTCHAIYTRWWRRRIPRNLLFANSLAYVRFALKSSRRSGWNVQEGRHSLGSCIQTLCRIPKLKVSARDLPMGTTKCAESSAAEAVCMELGVHTNHIRSQESNAPEDPGQNMCETWLPMKMARFCVTYGPCKKRRVSQTAWKVHHFERLSVGMIGIAVVN